MFCSANNNVMIRNIFLLTISKCDHNRANQAQSVVKNYGGSISKKKTVCAMVVVA